MSSPILLNGVRQNNLKNLTLEIPAKQFTVITGVSGSGKSSLAFDTLYAEGQRRYVDSLSTYTRQFLEKMPRPLVESVENIPPAIALEQRNHVLSSRSTVGSQTEIVDYLRLLFSKVGKSFCKNCGHEVKKTTHDSLLEWSVKWLPNRKALITAPLTLQSSKKTSLTSLFHVLQEQGFNRILWIPPKKQKPELLELEVMREKSKVLTKTLSKSLEEALASGAIHLVVDRLRVREEIDQDLRTRLSNSIQQSLTLGRGRIGFFDLDTSEWKHFSELFNCQSCGLEHRIPEPNLFSFNSPLGACPKCSGFGYTLELDESLLVPDPSKTLKNGAIDPFSKPSLSDWQKNLFRFAERHGISIGKRYRELTPAEKKLLWYGSPEDQTFQGIVGCFEELKRWKYKLHIRVFIRRYQRQSLCPECKGDRLTSDALCVKIGDRSISEVLDCSIEECLKWFGKLKLSKSDLILAKQILSQVERRLKFLEEVGVGYLTLSRVTKTLSGGEFQRINLATQLGNGLCGTLYVLDEPSIGLHAADTERLIKIIHRLRDQGNTVVVVEHDLEVMRNADFLIELGPGGGHRGGELIAQGKAVDLMAKEGSLTGKYLRGDFRLDRTSPIKPLSEQILRITGCQENNLKGFTVEIPLKRFVVVTGVSGSGKSSLVHKTLFNALSRIYFRTGEAAGKFDRLYGAEHLSGVVLLDQSPIGKSSRSNPATYLKAWDEIRKLYANQVLSLRRGYTPQYFSFNVEGGRCSVCKGEGEITLDMHFMADVKIPCEECDGKRFKKNILDVTYRGKDIHQLLHLTVQEAFELFRDNPVLLRKFGILRSVGLGYLQIGQSATTLSGGESQRLKIASCLDEKPTENLLYIFDEPTTGLHLEDIKKLLEVIQDLVENRHSVLMIEHNLDVIAQADFVVDLGPGGGENGGRLIASGTPIELAENSNSITGKMLKAQGFFA